MMQTVEREVINNEVIGMVKAGVPYREISNELKMSTATISMIAQRAGIAKQNIPIPEETSRAIAERLGEGVLYREISQEFDVGLHKIAEVAKQFGLGRNTTVPKEKEWGEGQTLEDIRKANPYNVGDKVSIRVKLSDDDKAVRHNCTVEQVTKCIVYARDDKGLMHSAMFAEIGIKTAKGAELIRRRG